MAEISTGTREDALDVVQDAMLQLVKNYGDRQEDEWRRLFHQVLQSRIMDWHRRNKVRSRWRVWLRTDDDGGVDPIESQADANALRPEQGVANERMTEALEDALNRLPLRQQQAFLLRIWEGLDVADTAKAMGCSQGSVKTHYSRAVHTLRGQLEGHYLRDGDTVS